LETLRKDLVSLTTDASKNDENIEELTQKIKEEEEKQKFAAAELDSVKIEVQEGSDYQTSHGSRYSEHSNTQLVPIGNGLFVSGSEMVRFFNTLAIQKPDKNVLF
jgi:hypothetical protein